MAELPGARYARTARQQYRQQQRRSGGGRVFAGGARFIHIDPTSRVVTVYENEQDMEEGGRNG